MTVTLAEMLALELSSRAIGDGDVNEFVVFHPKARGLSPQELGKLMGEVEFIMRNRIILQLKGN